MATDVTPAILKTFASAAVGKLPDEALQIFIDDADSEAPALGAIRDKAIRLLAVHYAVSTNNSSNNVKVLKAGPMQKEYFDPNANEDWYWTEYQRLLEDNGFGGGVRHTITRW